MDPITIILATLAAAAASDQEKKAAEQRARTGQSAPDPWASREALEVLGEAWPPNLTPLDWAWMEVLEASGTPVHSWTSTQLDAFREGHVVCPSGHDMGTGHMKYLDMDITESTVTPHPRKTPLTAVIDQTDAVRQESITHGLVRCTHPDHSHIDQVFWFPFLLFEIDYR